MEERGFPTRRVGVCGVGMVTVAFLDLHMPKRTPTHSYTQLLTVRRASQQQLAEEIQTVHFAQWGKQTLLSNHITLHNTPLIAQQYANKMVIGANRWFLLSFAMEPLMAVREAGERRGCRSDLDLECLHEWGNVAR